MSDSFIPPPFDPAAALEQARRQLRELRQLSERGATFSLKGLEVLTFQVSGQELVVQLAKRPQQRPEWERKTCRNAADVRTLLDEFKRRLRRWDDEA